MGNNSGVGLGNYDGVDTVDSLADLRAGRGAFSTQEEFYEYWRAYPFKTPRMIARELDKLLRRPPRPQ